MSNAITTGDWSDPKKKCEAVYNVLRELATQSTEALACVGRDTNAQNFFKKFGGIEVPVGARVIIFGSGEQALKLGSSVILEIPPRPLTDLELRDYVLGNYPYWPPTFATLTRPPQP